MTTVDMNFTEDAVVAGTRRTSDGYLVADVRTARTGIQLYLGREVGKPEMNLVRVYRPEDEVFSKESMASYAHRPVTDGHPKERVTADNWAKYAKGSVGDEIARDGEFVRVPLSLMDAAVIEKVEKRDVRQLSAGYRCRLEWTDGVTPDGEKYDAVQREIRINHVAVVPLGRAGPEARIGDDAIVESWDDAPSAVIVGDQKGMKPMTNMTQVSVTIDGISVEMSSKDAQIVQRALEKSDAQIKSLEKSLADSTALHSTAIAAKDAEIAGKDAELAKKDAEIDALKAKVPDVAALDALAQKRGDLIATAKAIHADVKTDGVSDADIRRSVVVARLGDAVVKDKTEAYIDARFDLLAEDAASASNVRAAVGSATLQPVKMGDAQTAEQKAFNSSVADLNAWRDKQA